MVSFFKNNFQEIYFDGQEEVYQAYSFGDGFAIWNLFMNWFILFLAGLFEIGWAIGLKYSDGFTRFWPSVGTIISLVASFLLLGFALKTLPLGTAYAVWVGIGSVGTAIFGILLFEESTEFLKLMSLTLICIGIVGLKLSHV